MNTTAEYSTDEVKRLYKRITELELWKQDAIERMEEMERFYQRWVTAESDLVKLAEMASVLTNAIQAARQQHPVDILFHDYAPFRNAMAYFEPKKSRRTKA